LTQLTRDQNLLVAIELIESIPDEASKNRLKEDVIHALIPGASSK
jgi:hypothetical protein